MGGEIRPPARSGDVDSVSQQAVMRMDAAYLESSMLACARSYLGRCAHARALGGRWPFKILTLVKMP